MAIEFKCSTCGRELFAQEAYAGMKTTCPGCQSKMLIPLASAATAAAPSDAARLAVDLHSDAFLPDSPHLIDMEKVDPAVPEKQALALNAVTAQAPPDTSQAPAENKVPEISEATKRCPMCAETIKAAAKKCRFCGEILDEDLKREAHAERRRDALVTATLAARHSNAIWRGMSKLVTMMTTGWLLYQTLNCIVLKVTPSFQINFLAPWTLYLFNTLLIGGMFSLIRQMRSGTFQVFLAAAFAIVACMPVDLMLGFPMQGLERFAEDAKSKSEFYKTWTMDDFYALAAFSYVAMGVLISLPVWLTALKVALEARKAAREKAKP